MTETGKKVFLKPGEGREYRVDRISAVFKADESENVKYSISEWTLDPNTKGPGAHEHPEDDIFFVTEGTMSILVENEWVEASKGAFVLAPGGTKHDFENRSDQKASVLNFTIPGDFERNMPHIIDWWTKNPPEDAR